MKYYAILKMPYSPANHFAEIKTTLQNSQNHLLNIAKKVRTENCCNVQCMIYDENNILIENYNLAW